MTLQAISRTHAVLRQVRCEQSRAVARAEESLQVAVVKFLESRTESLRDTAKVMDITPAYLCDIRHGRRKVSDQVVERLGRLK